MRDLVVFMYVWYARCSNVCVAVMRKVCGRACVAVMRNVVVCAIGL